MTPADHIAAPAAPHASRVLAAWLGTRPGAAQRAGVLASPDGLPTPAAGPAAPATIYNAMPLITSGTAGSELYAWLTGGLMNASAVSERTALQVGAVYACVGLIGGAIASMPLHLYKRDSDGGRDRYSSDLWWLFNESPHPAWTAANAWHFTLQSILLKGDAYWRVVRRGRYSSEIDAFEPLHPDHVFASRAADGSNVYTVTRDGASQSYAADDILHFAGVGFDGLRSVTPVRAALGAAASTALAADQHAGAFFRGGARPDHALELPADVKLSPDQIEALRTSWAAYRNSYATSGSTPLLTGGVKVTALSLNAEDAQLLQTRQYGVEEIARIFGVPPHMIGANEKTTSWGSGIEQMSIAFVRYTLGRHLDVIQQEINRKIWPRSARIFAEFSRDALLEGDSKSQAEYFGKALGGPGTQGWMLVNEVRRLKNLPPVEGGDTLTQAGAQAHAPTQQTAGTQ